MPQWSPDAVQAVQQPLAVVPLPAVRAVQDGALVLHDLLTDADVELRNLLAQQAFTERERLLIGAWAQAVHAIRECAAIHHGTALQLSEHTTTTVAPG